MGQREVEMIHKYIRNDLMHTVVGLFIALTTLRQLHQQSSIPNPVPFGNEHDGLLTVVDY